MLTSGTSTIHLVLVMASSVLLALVPVVGVGVGVEPRGWIRDGWAHCWVLRDQPAARVVVWWVAFWVMVHCFFEPAPCGAYSSRVVSGGGWWWDRLLFENYTVDASIFVAIFL